jgi:hypothetical protein
MVLIVTVCDDSARNKDSKHTKCNNRFPVPNFYTENKNTAQQYISWHTNSYTFVDHNKCLEANWLYLTFPSISMFYCGVQWSVQTGRPKTPPCVDISAGKFVCYNHKYHFYPDVYLWSKIELQYEKCSFGTRSFTSGQNVLYSNCMFGIFCSFPPENIKDRNLK